MHVKFATMHENEFTLQRRKKIIVNESLNDGVDICNKAYIQEVRSVDLLVTVCYTVKVESWLEK